jgi:hypothetical protein
MREPNAFWLGLELLIGGLVVVTAVLSKKRMKEWVLLTVFGAALIAIAFTGIPDRASLGQIAWRAIPFVAVAVWCVLAIHFAASMRFQFNRVYDDVIKMDDRLIESIATKLNHEQVALLATKLIMAIAPPQERIKMQEELSARIDSFKTAIDSLQTEAMKMADRWRTSTERQDERTERADRKISDLAKRIESVRTELVELRNLDFASLDKLKTELRDKLPPKG